MRKWNPDPVERLEDGTWIFWDETWADWHGPFMSEKECREALDSYGESLLLDQREVEEE